MTKKSPLPAPELSSSVFKFSFNIKCIILAALAFCFYINTVQNEYALDDTLVITNNKYVQQGFAGIHKILTTDTYDSYNQYMHGNGTQQLSGGRYRPLSVVVFAIEHQLFGESASIRHFVSVLAFIVCVLSIFYFLSNYLLKKMVWGQDTAFLAAVLFTIHPIHTEVVANIKSLDEILSLTLIMLTFIFSLKYIEVKKTLFLILGMASFLLALLAKEYAATLVILLPLAFYLLHNETPKQAVEKAVPYIGILVLYFIIRFTAVGIPHSVQNDKILTNPYLYATFAQKIATEIFVLSKYIILLFYPLHLSADYSYSQIVYHNFSDFSVWLTILTYAAITAWGVLLVIRKNILAFPVFFFLLNLALISNFLLDIGATMGERLIFHSSLGFVILVAAGLFKLTEKLTLTQKRQVMTVIPITLTLLCFGKTVTRNKEWKNDITLFTADVKNVPNSFMANGNAGMGYINIAMEPDNATRKEALMDTAMVYLKKSITIFKTYDVSYYNLGVCYLDLGNPDMAKSYWDTARQITPTYPPLQDKGELLGRAFLSKSMILASQKKVAEALVELKKGVHSDNNNADIWYNLGGAYYTLKQFDSARYCWQATLTLKPDYTQAKQGLGALPPQGKDTIKGIR